MIKFKHLETTGYTYTQHFKRSLRFSIRLLLLSFCALIHAIWPDVFKATVSQEITNLYKNELLDMGIPDSKI